MNQIERKWMLQGMVDEILMASSKNNRELARRTAVVFAHTGKTEFDFYIAFRGGQPTKAEIDDLAYQIAGLDLELDWDVKSNASRIELRERVRFYPKSHQQPGARTVDRGSTKDSPIYGKNKKDKK